LKLRTGARTPSKELKLEAGTGARAGAMFCSQEVGYELELEAGIRS